MKAFFFRISWRAAQVASCDFEPKVGAENFRRLSTGSIFDDDAFATLPKLVKIDVETRNPIAPDVIGAKGPWVVSKRFADTLRKLEPDVHRFAPIDVYWKTSGEFINTYEWMLVSETVEHFDLVQTKWRTKVGGGFGKEAAEDCQYDITFRPKNAVVKCSLIAGRTIWRGAPQYARKYHFCSGEFAKIYKSEKMRGLDLIEVQVD